MATNKTGLDYFPLNIDFFDDDKIQFVGARFGLKGENIAIRILCKIYSEGYFYKFGEDESLLFAKRVGDGCQYSFVNDVVYELVKRGFFDKSIFDRFRLLTSSGIQKRYFEAVGRRKDVEVYGRILLIDVSKMDNVYILPDNVYIISENGDISKQSKVKEKKKKISTIVDTKDAPIGAGCAPDPIIPSEKPLKTWKEDFSVYKRELDTAYNSLVNDQAFITERLKYHPKLDIRLSIEKAYTDYWGTEAGWKRKKVAKTKEIDWKRTFVNALTLGSNQVYQSAGKPSYVPVTEVQQKFTEYLKANAPLMLNMPVQPTDEEIAVLRDIKTSTLLSIIEEINNNRYLTNGRNSVYQTIMEIRSKYE